MPLSTTGQPESFTSLPPHEEAAFVVYENRLIELRKKAGNAALYVGIAVGAFALIVVLFFGSKKSAPGAHGGEAPAQQAK